MSEPEIKIEPKPLSEGAPPQGGDPPKPDWKDSRIGELTAKWKSEKEAGEAREARIKELEAQLTKAATPPAQGSGPSETEIQERIKTEATRLAAQEAEKLAPVIAQQQEFQRQCGVLVAEGKKAFEDWDARVADLQGLVIKGDKQSEASYWSLISAAIKTGQGPEVLHAIASDKNEATRLLALDPETRAIEIAKLMLASGDRKISSLPKPITPINKLGDRHTPIDPADRTSADKLSTAEWMARREAQVAENMKRGRA